MTTAVDEAGTVPHTDPLGVYGRRREERQATATQHRSRLEGLASGRLAAFVALGVVAYFALYRRGISAWWLVVPTALFAVLVIAYERASRRARRAARAAEFYERGLARLEDRWAGQGVPGTRYQDPEHPYAGDLDLFGPGSLFERLCTARTLSGERTLASWLLAPAEPDEIRARQEAVAELTPRLDLREDLALLGDDVRAGIDPDALASWGAEPPVLDSRLARVIAPLLAALGAVTLIGWGFLNMGRTPFLAVAMVEVIFTVWYGRRVRRVLAAVDEKAAELSLLGDLLARLEREPFDAPRVPKLVEMSNREERPPSRQVARLARLVGRLDAQRNILFAPIAFILLWGPQIAFAIEAWRRQSGGSIAGWLDAVGTIEALAALASYRFENPDDAFPEVLDDPGDAPQFEAEGLGHPLLPRGVCVTNNVRLGDDAPWVLIVSGSNMSGKSTLMRSVGVAAVLAQAGAPVRASRLRLSPLAVGATLRIQDSLQAGRSRFYAELVRVRQLVDLAGGPLPLLFLLDEIFHGTNSHDRRLGAEGVVRGLLDRNAIGLVSTHDLALADIAEKLAPRAANIHFEDQFHDGRMTFDYRMRPGIVRHSNALALMRAVGLDV